MSFHLSPYLSIKGNVAKTVSFQYVVERTLCLFQIFEILHSLLQCSRVGQYFGVFQAAHGLFQHLVHNAQLVGDDTKTEIVIKESIKLNQPSVTKEEAIRAAGELLVERGSVDPSYVEAMLEREKLVTTYMGMGIAIPHGTAEAKDAVKKTAISMLLYPEGVDFGDEKAQLVFGIAGIGDEHLDLLGKIAGTLDDPEVLEKMKTTDDVDWILEILS